jgi:hypothetical protein
MLLSASRLAPVPVSRPRGLAALPRPATRGFRVRAVEEKGTPQVMVSGAESDDEGSNLAGDYCSLDATGKRVKKSARRWGRWGTRGGRGRRGA